MELPAITIEADQFWPLCTPHGINTPLPSQHHDGLFDRGVRERERDKVWTLLTNMRAAALGIVEERRLREAYQSYLDGKSRARFWYTLTLEDWLRRHFS